MQNGLHRRSTLIQDTVVINFLRAQSKRPINWIASILMAIIWIYFETSISNNFKLNPKIAIAQIIFQFALSSSPIFITPLFWMIKPRFFFNTKFYNFFQASLLNLLFLACLIFIDFTIQNIPLSQFRKTFYNNLMLMYPLFLGVGGLVAAYESQAKENEATRRAAQSAQIRLLQSQLNPHVLFNALNGLAELIHQQPYEAEQCVRAMSDLFRKLLRSSLIDTQPLREERSMLEDFLWLWTLRLEDRLQITWDWPSQVDGFELPPLLLQPLVENAIKHGIAPALNGGKLKIVAISTEKNLCLRVENNGLPLISARKTGHSPGIGLSNLQERLDLAYRSEATLTLTQQDEWVIADIRIPLSRIPSHEQPSSRHRG